LAFCSLERLKESFVWISKIVIVNGTTWSNENLNGLDGRNTKKSSEEGKKNERDDDRQSYETTRQKESTVGMIDFERIKSM